MRKGQGPHLLREPLGLPWVGGDGVVKHLNTLGVELRFKIRRGRDLRIEGIGAQREGLCQDLTGTGSLSWGWNQFPLPVFFPSSFISCFLPSLFPSLPSSSFSPCLPPGLSLIHHPFLLPPSLAIFIRHLLGTFTTTGERQAPALVPQGRRPIVEGPEPSASLPCETE